MHDSYVETSMEHADYAMARLGQSYQGRLWKAMNILDTDGASLQIDALGAG